MKSNMKNSVAITHLEDEIVRVQIVHAFLERLFDRLGRRIRVAQKQLGGRHRLVLEQFVGQTNHLCVRGVGVGVKDE